METKCIEIRDHGTCIPALAIKMIGSNEIERGFFSRCGYPLNNPLHPGDWPAVVLMELNKQQATSDPYEWGGRTYPVAHNYIYENFDSIPEGSVVDVRVILGEAETPAEPEIMESTNAA